MIEVMTALGILGIVLVAVSNLSVGTIRANGHARKVTAATNLARDKMETLRAQDYWTVTSGADPFPLTESGVTSGNGAIYNRSWTLSSGPTNTTLTLKVTVEWQDVTTQKVELRSLLGS